MEMHFAAEPKRILVVGGGFGGIRAALDLAHACLPNTKITLVSDKHHFEYTPALYKLATGASPIETCIPLAEIFAHTKIEILIDTIKNGSLAEKTLVGESGSRYRYDFLILALGSETAYFNIPGIAENAFSLKSVQSALQLKNHLHELFSKGKHLSKGGMMSQFQFVVVGGGPAGVELAGVIRAYARKLGKIHMVPQSLITVDILQSAPRLLPTFPQEASKRAAKRLDQIGINIILGRAVTAETERGVAMKDIRLNAKTIIWTAGVRASHVYANIQGLTLDKGGRIIVDEHMHPTGSDAVFVIGDSASTPHAGTAQTANYDGKYVPQAVIALLKNKPLPKYAPKITPYVVPIGEHWAIFAYKNIILSGFIYGLLRELIDFKFFLTILPFQKAFAVWRSGSQICESCPTCESAEIGATSK